MNFMKPNMPSQYPRRGAPPFSLSFAHQFSQTSATVRTKVHFEDWECLLLIALKTESPATRATNKASPSGPKARA